MKKTTGILAVLLALVLALSLFACGSDTPKDAGSTKAITTKANTTKAPAFGVFEEEGIIVEYPDSVVESTSNNGTPILIDEDEDFQVFLEYDDFGSITNYAEELVSFYGENTDFFQEDIVVDELDAILVGFTDAEVGPWLYVLIPDPNDAETARYQVVFKAVGPGELTNIKVADFQKDPAIQQIIDSIVIARG